MANKRAKNQINRSSPRPNIVFFFR